MKFTALKWTAIAGVLLLAPAPWTRSAAQIAPVDAVCCRGSTQQLIDDTRARINQARADLAQAQSELSVCDATARSAACPAAVEARYNECMAEPEREMRAYCQGPSEEQCSSIADSAARQSCITLASLSCQKQHKEDAAFSGRLFPGGNQCLRDLRAACPTPEQACSAQRVALNQVMAQMSELNYGLRKIEQLAGPPRCVQLQIVGHPNDSLCSPTTVPEMQSVASYSCVGSGGLECVFTECRVVPRKPQPLPITMLRMNIVGKDIRSSGLQGTPGNYHTDYTVAFTAQVSDNAEVKWQENLRSEGPRSWYGYHYSGCKAVSLREYCVTQNRPDYVRSLPRPPHGTVCR